MKPQKRDDEVLYGEIELDAANVLRFVVLRGEGIGKFINEKPLVEKVLVVFSRRPEDNLNNSKIVSAQDAMNGWKGLLSCAMPDKKVQEEDNNSVEDYMFEHIGLGRKQTKLFVSKFNELI